MAMTNSVPGSDIDIRIDCDLWAGLDTSALVQRAYDGLCRNFADIGGPVSVLFSDDEALRILNRDFRDKDAPTNVLSFPGDPDAPPELYYLGDIALAFETCKAEAAAQQKTLSDHVQHLLVHGMLHLIGYDHQDDAGAAEMEALEISMLKGLGIGDPYCHPQGDEDE